MSDTVNQNNGDPDIQEDETIKTSQKQEETKTNEELVYEATDEVGNKPYNKPQEKKTSPPKKKQTRKKKNVNVGKDEDTEYIVDKVKEKTDEPTEDSDNDIMIEEGDIDDTKKSRKVEIDESPEEETSDNKKRLRFFRRKTNADLMNLRDLDLDGTDITKISSKRLDAEESDYVDKISDVMNMVNMARVTTIPMVSSGYSMDISAYNYSDLLNINRYIANNEISYVAQQETIIHSIFKHIKRFSCGKMDEETWLEKTYLPDMAMSFFGAYDSSSPGENPYNIRCKHCNHLFELRKPNDEIVCYTDDRVTQKDINLLLKTTNLSIEDAVDSIPVSKYVTKTVISSVLPETKVIVERKIPNLMDYLTMLNAIARLENHSLEDIEDPESPSFFILNMLLYINKLKIPVQDKKRSTPDDIKYTYHHITNKNDIAEFICSLSPNDTSKLFEGEEIAKLVSFQPVKFRIEGDHCEKCKEPLGNIRLDMKNIFFGYTRQVIYATMNL